MLASFLLAVREGIEAALIIGIVLGALRKLQRADLVPALWWGTGAAALVSVLVGVGLTAMGLSLRSPAEQVFEGMAMLLAAGVLTWMIFWMSRQARYIKADLETGVRRAAMMRSSGALFGLAFLAVFREGIELALFLAAAAHAAEPSAARDPLVGHWTMDDRAAARTVRDSSRAYPPSPRVPRRRISRATRLRSRRRADG